MLSMRPSSSEWVRPSTAPLRYTFSRAVSSGLKPTPSSRKGETLPVMLTEPPSGA